MQKTYSYEFLCKILQDYELVQSLGTFRGRVSHIEARQSRDPDTDDATVEITAHFEELPRDDGKN